VELCDTAWTREQPKIFQASNASRQKFRQALAARCIFLSRLLVAFSIRQPLRRPYLKSGSNDMRLPVR
jgi:hypothetical protein